MPKHNRKWPWNDTHEGKLKRIAESYRVGLMDSDPEKCALIDARMIEFGERWIASDTIIDVNRMVTAREITEEYGLPAWSVHDWARKYPEEIPKHKQADGSVLFRMGDVLAFHAQRTSGLLKE